MVQPHLNANDITSRKSRTQGNQTNMACRLEVQPRQIMIQHFDRSSVQNIGRKLSLLSSRTLKTQIYAKRQSGNVAYVLYRTVFVPLIFAVHSTNEPRIAVERRKFVITLRYQDRVSLPALTVLVKFPEAAFLRVPIDSPVRSLR